MNLARLLQLASPALPVGAYSYSGGLESAVEAGIVKDRESAERWIGDVLELGVARMDAPLLLRMIREPESSAHWNAIFLASRETSELRAETVQMGYSFNLLLRELEVTCVPLEELSFPAAFAHAASHWRIEPESALVAYLWSWLENQVMAAVKALPLGQTEGQQAIAALEAPIAVAAEAALDRPLDDLGGAVWRADIASMKHETQYTRLFRS